ncbi:pentatricopeptide repeat-containing protein At4g35130, chloroplastic [Salvia hispanica]|uniref:pentatricopeptide repeat-containing protein At4g35130, chloroplastic n=1 Tax=Salvia hispanica TaxID=49212 RepID=UPI002009465F|nr:pentatricopeptide repeat-containing protein At4g35130, chloroplastic [Salvia hispanica]
MAKELLNLRLHILPPTSEYRYFPAIQASNKSPNHGLRIRSRNSRKNTTSPRRRKFRSVEGSILSFKRLLYCVSSGCLETALQLFDKMDKSDIFVWNVMIRGLVDSGMFQEAVEMYYRMQIEGIEADNFTFPFVIKACVGLKEGQNVHSMVIKLGFDEDVYICNALIVMYAKVGCIEESERVFERMLVRDLVSWNSMVRGYVLVGDGRSSLMCFKKMQRVRAGLDRISCVSALGACVLERRLLSGKEIFCQVVRNGLDLDPMIQSSVIDMFGKCGEVDYAERYFERIVEKNVVVWNSMIGAFAVNGKPFESFSCVEKMQDGDNYVAPDTVTLINLLPSCSNLRALLQGKAVHGYALRKGYLSHLVLETALVDMYGKCGRLVLAESVFCRMKARNLVSWNAMIAAFVQNSKEREALETFKDLQLEPYVPDEMTFASTLAGYAEIALPKEGEQIHALIYKLGISLGVCVANALIHMYSKCGDLEAARKVFDRLELKDLVSWNTIIMAYAIHGFGSYCFGLFSDMINEGHEPNGSTFVSLLSACSIAGLLDDGWNFFDSMKRDYGVDPGIEHYGCVLDLLGRAGYLERAKCLIEEMPLEPTSRIWGSLLAASRHHRDITMAELAADRIFSLDSDNTGCYVLLANMYAEVGRWEDVERIRNLMKKQGLKMTSSCSIVEHNGITHNFKNHDKTHGESYAVYEVLDILSRMIGEDSLHFSGVSELKPVESLKARGNSPMFHSVRLATCFGLIKTARGQTVLIRKNVRLCEDCHSATKKISLVTKREIVVGDSKVFHHFKDGRCSCGDYW